MKKELTQEAIKLLKDLISIQSFSSEENETAARLEQWFTDHEIPFFGQTTMCMHSIVFMMKRSLTCF